MNKNLLKIIPVVGSLVGCASSSDFSYSQVSGEGNLDQKLGCITTVMENYAFNKGYDLDKLRGDNVFPGIENMCFRNNSPVMNYVFSDGDWNVCKQIGGDDKLCHSISLRVDDNGNVYGCSENDTNCYSTHARSFLVGIEIPK